MWHLIILWPQCRSWYILISIFCMLVSVMSMLSIVEERNGINYGRSRSIFCMLGCVGTYLRKEMGSIMGRIDRMQSRDLWAAGLPSTKALYSAASCCASWLSQVYLNTYVHLHYVSIFCIFVWVEQRPPVNKKKALYTGALGYIYISRYIWCTFWRSLKLCSVHSGARTAFNLSWSTT